jgi:hypothetical protein
MSDTPISDSTPHNVADLGMLCRRLERQLSVANERIKRLDEALNGTVKWIVDLANSGDAGFWNPEEQSVIIAARAALNKEANP